MSVQRTTSEELTRSADLHMAEDILKAFTLCMVHINKHAQTESWAAHFDSHDRLGFHKICDVRVVVNTPTLIA